MRVLATGLAAVLLLATDSALPAYRFLEVKNKVVVRQGGAERRAAAGDTAGVGDEVQTGWWGRAVLEIRERASRFEILPATRVRLGGDGAGVLVVLERGRLKAFFDALTGNDERIVATPGALLAVRGTRYGVEVAADGTAVVAVFEGAVEVRPAVAAFPVTIVEAGQACRFGPRLAPERGPLPHGVTEQGWRGGLDGHKGQDGRDGASGARGSQPGAGPSSIGSPGARQTGPGRRGGGGGA